MPEMGKESVANAGLTGLASSPGPADRPTTSLLQGSTSRQTQFHEAPTRTQVRSLHIWVRGALPPKPRATALGASASLTAPGAP